jgi:DNA modification methylase
LHYKGPNIGKPSGNPLGKNPSDFWKDIVSNEFDDCIMDIPNVKANHPEKTIHPCQFPIELIERFVLALTDQGDCVFDPYAGVGSTIIAALKNNRLGLALKKKINMLKLQMPEFKNS